MELEAIPQTMTVRPDEVHFPREGQIMDSGVLGAGGRCAFEMSLGSPKRG